jgi:haloalkane dehalogenase
MNAAEFHAARQFIPTSFGRIAYIERGSRPVALFLHGFPLNGFQWRDVLEDLAAIRRCVAPDLMGLGYSEIPPGQDISFGAQAKMLAAFLDTARIDSVDLVGNDSGGGISQVFAATYPARVRTLTLTNCEVHDLWPTAMLEPLFAAIESGAAATVIGKMAKDAAIARVQLASTYEYADRISPELARIYFQPLVASKERAELLRGFGNAKRNREQMVALAPQLGESKVPAQVIWAEADTAFDLTQSLEWLRGNLGSLRRVIMVPRAKLFFPEEHPRLVSTLLKDFWSGD